MNAPSNQEKGAREMTSRSLGGVWPITLNREASGSHRGVGACLADDNQRGNLKHKPTAGAAAFGLTIKKGRVI